MEKVYCETCKYLNFNVITLEIDCLACYSPRSISIITISTMKVDKDNNCIMYKKEIKK